LRRSAGVRPTTGSPRASPIAPPSDIPSKALCVIMHLRRAENMFRIVSKTDIAHKNAAKITPRVYTNTIDKNFQKKSTQKFFYNE